MSPWSVPSGCGRGKEITSVRPRCPNVRRFRAFIRAGDSRVTETRAPGAPSQASTRRTTVRRRRSVAGGRRRRPGRLLALPARRDAATIFRVVNAVVVHPREDANELRLHLVELLERDGRFVELARRQLVLHE